MIEAQQRDWNLRFPINMKAKGKNVIKKKGYYWYREKSGVAEVFKSVKKVEKEMGASAKLISLINCQQAF